MKKLIIAIIVFAFITVISIVYNTLPRLELNGTKNIIISYRDTYQEPGVILKNANKDYISKVKIESNIDNTKIGDYYVDYSLQINRKNLSVRRNVRIVDDIAPIIKLNGNQIVEISINSKYKELGFSAYDEYDGDLTNSVEVIGEVDTKNYGEYVLTYRVFDNSNNKTEVNRIVKVIDEEAPKIVCKSDYSAFVVGTDNVIGCQAMDNFDGDITTKIKVEGTYDINTKGIYSVTYSVKDDAGNVTSLKHNIVLYEKSNKTAFLTFDDGPTELTPKILQILKNEDVHATFFISPQKKTENYKYIKEELEQGNEIGIHGFHNTLELYQDIETFKSYFEEMHQLLLDYTNSDIQIYRFPGGSKSKNLNSDVFNQIKKYLKQKEITYYDWNIDSTDSTSLTITKDEILENTIKQIINSNNDEITILMHDLDTKQSTVESLPIIIQILKEMNYDFKTISASTPIQFR